MKSYDLVVIGGGTGGYRLAIKSASQGLKTALIEPGILGGTCLNWGCIPTKAMLHAAGTYATIQNKELKDLGIKASATVDFKKLMKRVQGIIKEGHVHIDKAYKKKNLTIYEGLGEFLNEHTIKVNDQKIKGKQIVIATGGKNFCPPIPGIGEVGYITNREAIYLKELPKSITMIGGGYICMEFATFFSQLGCKVTILERVSHVLSQLDVDISERIAKLYEEKGITIKTGVHIQEVKKVGKKKKIIYSQIEEEQPETTKGKKKAKKNTLPVKEFVTSDEIFVSCGVIPNTKDLGAEKAGVKLHDRGWVPTNTKMQTNKKHIFALGDVTGRALFAHAAKREVRVILNTLNGKKDSFNHELVPWAVFTSPPIAGIGQTEHQIPKSVSYDTLEISFKKNGRAQILNETDGFIKIHYEKKTEKILGVFIIGPRADDLIHEYVALMTSKKATLAQVREIIHTHPTLSELNEHV